MNRFTIKKIDKEKILQYGLPTVAVLAIICAGYFFYQNHQLKQNPQTISAREIRSVIKKVSSLAVLPMNEVPTVATVSDLNALKGQAFFADAKKGDKVIIYRDAKKAILFDPIANKIITMAPLNVSENKKSDTSTTTNLAPSEVKLNTNEKK